MATKETKQQCDGKDNSNLKKGEQKKKTVHSYTHPSAYGRLYISLYICIYITQCTCKN